MLDALQFGKLNDNCASWLKQIVLADLHDWDFVNEYKQNPIPEDDCVEKKRFLFG